MSKIIVVNNSDLTDIEALVKVCRVIEGGKISDHGKCYCYVTRFSDGYTVYAKTNKASYAFTVN